MKMYDPCHPGEILQCDYLEPANLSVREMAKVLGVSHSSLSRIINGQSSITPDMAIRLERATGLAAASWLQMQMDRDLWEAEQQNMHLEIERVPVFQGHSG